jgi:poly-gamma-glutamate synthesis protein (capsule biosynthesis protein)
MRPGTLIPLAFVLLFATLRLAAADEQDRPLDFSQSRFDAPADPTQDRPLVLMFTGDTKLEGRTAQQIAQKGRDYPFKAVAEILRGADLCFGNCETAITDYAKHTPGKPADRVKKGLAFVFKSDPRSSGPILADAGFDVMQLANNHAMDYCAQGLADTLVSLDAAGIRHVGAGKDYAEASAPLIVDVDGTRIGFLAYSQIIPPQSAARTSGPGISYLPANYKRVLDQQIADLREQADVVIVCFHWGVEGTNLASQVQRSIGHWCIDNGADLVIGSHPHTFQGIEHYKEGLIAYSLGNFVFTGKSSRLAGGILRVTLDRRSGRPQLDEAALLPCWIDAGVPRPSQDESLLRQLGDTLRTVRSRLGADSEGWHAVEVAR